MIGWKELRDVLAALIAIYIDVIIAIDEMLVYFSKLVKEFGPDQTTPFS